jgi:hypothetical protein
VNGKLTQEPLTTTEIVCVLIGKEAEYGWKVTCPAAIDHTKVTQIALQIFTYSYSVRVRITLQLMVSQSVSLGVEPNLGLLTRDIFFLSYCPEFVLKVTRMMNFLILVLNIPCTTNGGEEERM